MKIALFLNGKRPSEKVIPKLGLYEEIICADGAYNYLKEMNIDSNRVFGDFDSIQKTKKDSSKFIYTEDQDYTDFDKILMILDKESIDEIHVFGGSGEEQDHFLGNLTVANRWKKRFKIIFFDEYHYYFFAEKEWTASALKNRLVSLMPYPVVSGISSEGLKYKLDNDDLSIEERIGIRNKAVENNVKVTFKHGNLIIFVAHE